MKFIFLFSFLLTYCCYNSVQGHEDGTMIMETLTSAQLYEGLEMGNFDVLVDVRTASEFAAGHIPNATLMENLAVTGFPNAKPEDLAGCEHCLIAVYCQSGARAAVAINHLMEAGFHVLYNGGGLNQWTAAGYPVVTGSDSVTPGCTTAGRCTVNASSNLFEPNNPIESPVQTPVESSPMTSASNHGIVWKGSYLMTFIWSLAMLVYF